MSGAGEDPPSAPESPPAPPADDSKVTRLADRRRRLARARPAPPLADNMAVRVDKARQSLGGSPPYTPIGYSEGIAWVIEASGELRGMRHRDLSRNAMLMVCGGVQWLSQRYPRFRQGKPVDGFAAEKAHEELIFACQLMGPWSPDGHVRGVGAWLGADGDLILHRGHLLMVNGRAEAVGRHGDFIYLPRPALPRLPAAEEMARLPKTAGVDCAAASMLLDRLDTFYWSRGTFDSYLMLGMICCGILGGALAFRPHVWVTGDLGTGKSLYQNVLLGNVFYDLIISVTDATEAGLRQRLKFSSAPIGIDELEAREDSDKPGGIIHFARQATTGGTVLRGGANHEGAEFMVQSVFFASSIIVPPMAAQDRSRWLRIELLSEQSGAFRPLFSADNLEWIGGILTRRLMERWSEFRNVVQPTFKRTMREQGYPDRIADLYSTVFAAAGVALHDDINAMEFHRMLHNHHMVSALAEALVEQTPEWRRCFDHLLSSRTDRTRPLSATIGELIARATRPMLNPGRHLMTGQLFDAEGEEIIEGDDDDRSAMRARDQLLSFGIRVGFAALKDGGRGVVVMLANQHRALAELFERSVWKSLPEASGGGGWIQVGRRAPGAHPMPQSVRFRAGVRSRALAIPVDVIMPDDRPRGSAMPEGAAEGESRDGVALH